MRDDLTQRVQQVEEKAEELWGDQYYIKIIDWTDDDFYIEAHHGISEEDEENFTIQTDHYVIRFRNDLENEGTWIYLFHEDVDGSNYENKKEFTTEEEFNAEAAN